MELERFRKGKIGRIAHLRHKKEVDGLEPSEIQELQGLVSSVTPTELDLATLLKKRSEACGD